MEWGQLAAYLAGAATSPLLLRLAEWFLSGIRSNRADRAAARRVIALQLDPLLKSADELQAKLRSLAEDDFADFDPRRTQARDPFALAVSRCAVLYLFAQFWGRLEVLRRESFHVELAATSEGRLLLAFLRTLESKRIRIVDRAWQRAVGELALISARDRSGAVSFSKFVEDYEAESASRRWLLPLEELFDRTASPEGRVRRKARQRLLAYGVAVHAMIDTIDPKHRTTRERPGYPNKLTRRSKRDLIGLFDTFLTDVKEKDIAKYTAVTR